MSLECLAYISIRSSISVLEVIGILPHCFDVPIPKKIQSDISSAIYMIIRIWKD
jgi:hypothetical protein